MVFDARHGCKARQEAGITTDKDKEAVFTCTQRE